jgi:GT2 family glycosyltransferase
MSTSEAPRVATPTASQPRVTVVVVTWNGAHLLPACLDSLRVQTQPHRVLVVDNASADGTAELLTARYPEACVVRLDSNTGFAGGAQSGLDATSTPYAAFLNNDAVADPGWLSALIEHLDADPSLAAVTSRLLLAEDGRVNNAGGALNRWGVGYDRGYGAPDGPPYDEPVDVAAFCGGAAVLRVDDARRVGGFDPTFFLYYEDTDLSWRLGTAGRRIRYVPDAVVHHQHSASTDQASAAFAFYNQRNQLLMLIRNAPASVVVAALLRFFAVTAIGLVRRRSGHTGRLRHRLHVLSAVTRQLPRRVRERRRIGRAAVVSRRTFCRKWLGVDER